MEVPVTGDALTVKDAVAYVDENDANMTVTGLATGYITAVNNETAGTYGGWDGWTYSVNGVDPSVGIADYTLNDGDSVVLYYGDPWGVGMQKPVLDMSCLGAGILRLISVDVTYGPAPDYTVTTTENPVAGALVTWGYGEATAQYTTDQNGEIVIAAAQLASGNHSVQIVKYANNGCPLVLRCAPDYAVTLAPSVTPLATENGAPLIVDRTNSFLILRNGAMTVGELMNELAPAAFLITDGTDEGNLLTRGDTLFTGAAIQVINSEGVAADTLKVVAAGEIDAARGLDVTDARAALRFAAGLNMPTALELAAADLDRDGKVTIPEARTILRVFAELDSFSTVS